MEEALHLKGQLRFVALFMATIVGPSMILAYFGVTSIRAEELAIVEEIERLAEDVTGTFWKQVDEDFSLFEAQVLDRLEAGRSPLEGAGELHPNLLVALRFDKQGRLVAPFQINENDTSDAFMNLFHPDFRRAHQTVDAILSAQRFSQAERRATTREARGRARLEQARMLEQANAMNEARAVLESVAIEFPDVLDNWGFRLGDIARLKLGEMSLLGDGPSKGVRILRTLVDDLFDRPWTLGQGGEAAVVRRALARLEPHSSREWAAGVRERLAERNAMLYWASHLQDELKRIPINRAEGFRPGDLRWNEGADGLWASTRWDGDYYVFGLDRAAIISGMKADARASVRHDAPVVVYLQTPDEPTPASALTRRSLAPWLSGWSVISTSRDPAQLAHEQNKTRLQRIGIIGFAITMMAFGAILSARLISRELDVVRMKTTFAANVSHELRSPITQIRLKGESLLFGLAETEAEQEEHYQAILRESERLTRLVDNVLDYAAIDQGSKNYALREGNLIDTVYRAIESIQTSLELQGIDVEVDVPGDLPLVHHDENAIAQCLVNLISNAAKYSDEDVWIGVLGRRVEGGVELAVSDKGIGIAAHDIQRVFEPFFRSRNNKTSRRKGTGIGLTITRYIMEAHGGSISVQSRLGKGSTFSLRFPLEPPKKRRTPTNTV